MKLILISLLAGLAELSAVAKDIPYLDLTITLEAGATVGTNAESGCLEVSWGTPDPHWSPLYLEQCPAELDVAKTNVQARIAQLAGFSAQAQIEISRGMPTLQRLTASTNEVTLGSWKVTEVLVTASYRDRDFGTINYACWFWAAGGKIWQAELLFGTKQHIAKAREIIRKIKLRPGKSPAATTGRGNGYHNR